MKKVLLAAILAGATLTAQAGEAEVRKNLQGKVEKIDSVTKAPLAGIWEVVADGQVLYVDDSGSFGFLGSLVDLKGDRNYTAERRRDIDKSAVMGSLNLALKQVRGNGKHVLVTFEDPNCGYCKKLAKELLKVKDVTVYTYLFPVLGPDSVEKSKAIWCAADKSKAWVDWMTNGKALGTAPEKCDMAGLEKSMELGRRLRINGTPAMFFADGERVPSYMPANEIEKRLAGS